MDPSARPSQPRGHRVPVDREPLPEHPRVPPHRPPVRRRLRDQQPASRPSAGPSRGRARPARPGAPSGRASRRLLHVHELRLQLDHQQAARRRRARRGCRSPRARRRSRTSPRAATPSPAARRTAARPPRASRSAPPRAADPAPPRTRAARRSRAHRAPRPPHATSRPGRQQAARARAATPSPANAGRLRQVALPQPAPDAHRPDHPPDGQVIHGDHEATLAPHSPGAHRPLTRQAPRRGHGARKRALPDSGVHAQRTSRRAASAAASCERADCRGPGPRPPGRRTASGARARGTPGSPGSRTSTAPANRDWISASERVLSAAHPAPTRARRARAPPRAARPTCAGPPVYLLPTRSGR